MSTTTTIDLTTSSLSNSIVNKNKERQENLINKITDKYVLKKENGIAIAAVATTPSPPLAQVIDNNSDIDFRKFLLGTQGDIMIAIPGEIEGLNNTFAMHSLLFKQIEFFRNNDFSEIFKKNSYSNPPPLVGQEDTTTDTATSASNIFEFPDLKSKAFEKYREFFYLRKLKIDDSLMSDINLGDLIKCAVKFRDTGFLKEIFTKGVSYLWKRLVAIPPPLPSKAKKDTSPPQQQPVVIDLLPINWNFFRVIQLISQNKLPESLQVEFAKNMLFGDTAIPKKSAIGGRAQVPTNNFDDYFKLLPTMKFGPSNFVSLMQYVERIIIPLTLTIKDHNIWVANYSKFETFYDSLITAMLRIHEQKESTPELIEKWKDLITNKFPLDEIQLMHAIEMIKKLPEEFFPKGDLKIGNHITRFDMLSSHVIKIELRENEEEAEAEDVEDYEDEDDEEDANNNNKKKKLTDAIDLRTSDGEDDDDEDEDEEDDEDEEEEDSFVVNTDEEEQEEERRRRHKHDKKKKHHDDDNDGKEHIKKKSKH